MQWKIIDKLKELNKLKSKYVDKLLHFLGCFFLVIVLAKFSLIASVLITLAIGFLIEIWDKLSYGLFSIKDLLADTIGIFIAFLILYF